MAELVVSVRIWCSGYMDSNVHQYIQCGPIQALWHHGNVGHASIQIADQYISMWPQECSRLMSTVSGEVDNSTVAIDMIRENGRAPDHVFHIVGLDVEGMLVKVQQLRRSELRYHLFGRNHFFQLSTANSCSGLVYDLLMIGGIHNRSPRRHWIRDYVITTPNNLVPMLQSIH